MTTRIISYSELASARQCLHKHDLEYRQRWVAPRKGRALTIGTLWHQVMERRYQTGGTFPSMDFRDLLWQENGERDEIQDLVAWMFDGYVAKWNQDRDWKILAVEHVAHVWLPTPRGTRSSFLFKMKIDLVVKIDGRIWLVDHKSGQNLPTEKDLALDTQFGLYTWGLRKLGKNVHGAIYNAARTQRNKAEMRLEDRFSRTLLYRTEDELENLAVEAYKTARRMYQHEEGYAERSPVPDTCGWKCSYTEPCLAGLKGLDEREFLLSAGYEQQFERH